MPHITIEVDEGLMKKLESRAKTNFLTSKELIEDIIRRSMMSYKKGYKPMKVDDRLVEVFSRENKGRKKKSK